MDREAKISELISQMTIEEKVSQLSHASAAIPRLEIPEYNWWNECLHGVARAGVATVFPQAIALAATFDESFVEEVATAISDEARAKYNEAIKQGNRGQYWGLTFWTPNINIFRDPRWGRGQETYGEDPYLTSRIGCAFVRGLQGDDSENLKLAACAKHYALHSGPEKLRHTFDAVVSKKDLFETYMPAFKALVDAGVESVMGAYNRTFGEPCCGSYYLLKDILRDLWGFKGHVVSDCWAIRDFHEYHNVTKTQEESAALALNAGCDLNCGCTFPMLAASYKKGLVSEEAINTALARLLRTRFKLGMFEPEGSGKYGKLGREVINCEKHQQLAQKAAEKSIVLLKNGPALNKSGALLPLDDSAKRITLVGPSAANPLALFGNYYGISPRFVTFLEGFGAKMQNKYAISLEYRPGCLQYTENTYSQFGSQTGFFTGSHTDLIIAVMGLDGCIEGEESDAIASDSNGDRDTIELPPWQLAYLRMLKESGKPVILVLTGGSPIAFPEDIADAVIFAWYPGEKGGEALADIIFGDVVPSGKLPITFPSSTEQLPPYEDYSMKGRTYRYMTEKPLYPFGFGLSYTSFRFDSISLSVSEISTTALASSSIKATVTLSNTGKRDAEEVVQIYISRDDRGADDPLSSLRSFRRVFVPAGKSTTVEFELSSAAYETINAEGASVLLPGPYTVIASDAAPVPVSVEKGAPALVSAKLRVQ